MLRLSLLTTKFYDINIVFSAHLFVNTTMEFSFKNPKELINFYINSKIKKVKVIILLGIGFERIDFFTVEEHNAVMKVLTSASELSRTSKEIYE